MSLRLRISRLLLALLAGGALLLLLLTVDTLRSSIREEMEAGSRVATRLLGASLEQCQGDPVALKRFLGKLGRVRANEIRLIEDGHITYVSPPSTYKAGRDAPAWFVGLVAPQLDTITLKAGAATLEIHADASRSVLDAWDDLLRLLLPPVVLMGAALILVFWRVGRELSPVARIEAALARVEAGERNLRLPAFGVAELDRIGGSFNRMVARLAHTEQETRDLEREVYAEGIARAQLERARREWARELHDELGQNLTAIGSLARSIVNRSEAGPVADAASLIQQAAGVVHEDLRAMLTRMRTEETGIDVALSRLVEHWRACHPGTPCELDCEGDFADLPEPRRLALFRVAQEALTNAARHAGASMIRIALHREAAGIKLEVADDGSGFDPARRGNNRFGLKGMAERLAECGGRLDVLTAPGQGTRILAALPV